MAEWLYEDGIGEARAMLVDGGRVLEMAIEPEGDEPRAGAIFAARLVAKADGGGRGRVAIAAGEAVLQPVPAGLTEGARLTVELVRAAYVEPGGQPKPARVRAVDDQAPRAGPDLRARVAASGLSVRDCAAVGDDPFEANDWSQHLEEATSGVIAEPQAMLRISLTPAMTLIDVDGAGAPAALAIAGAGLAAAAIRRFAIMGSIGIDLPTLADRADRLAAAAAVDALLPQPFERTAVNGFGFLQIVRRRSGASLMELLAADPVQAAARALLRRAERARGHGGLRLAAAPAVVARLEAHPHWLDQLRRRTGASLGLRPDPALAISAGHAQYDQA